MRRRAPDTQSDGRQSSGDTEVYGDALRATFLALLDSDRTQKIGELAEKLRIPAMVAKHWAEERRQLDHLTPQQLRVVRERWVKLIGEVYEVGVVRLMELLRAEDLKDGRMVVRAVSTLGNEFRLWAGMATEIHEAAQRMSDEELGEELYKAYLEAGLTPEQAGATMRAYMGKLADAQALPQLPEVIE